MTDGRQIRIAYLSEFDPLNVLSWSGCSHYFVKALSAIPSVSLSFLGPLRFKTSLVYSIKARFYASRGKNYIPHVEPRVLDDYARQVTTALKNCDADIILALNAKSFAHLETKKPILYFWDSTFLGNLDYPWFKNLASESIRHGHQMEQMALDKCRLAVFSSEWAVQTAIEGYQVDRQKLRVAPLGANLECNRTIEDVTRMVEARSSTSCNLLFIGVDWIRKGGDVAFEVAKQLNARGLETTLTVVGCEPIINESLPEFVINLGFLNKFENDSLRVIENLLADSHFLIVPSMAESFGAVFCEASSFATPSLARRIGGVSAAVRDGLNGRLFSKDAKPKEYCDYIMSMFNDYGKYRSMALASFEEYNARLNWGRTSERIVGYCKEILDGDVQ